MASVYDEIVVDHCHDQWVAYLDRVWQSDATPVRSVLDLCCGTGLMSAALMARAYRVVGVDGSAAMLARARKLLGQDVPLFRQVLPHLAVDGTFDAAVSTFDGFNYLDVADLRATLVAVSGRLRPRGWLAFDMHTDALMEFTAANPVVHGEANGYDFVISSDVDTAERTCDTRIDVTGGRDGRTFTERHRQYFPSDDEIRAALRAAGFGLVSVTAEYTDTPLEPTSLRATWLARTTR
ncbi:MAG TPA: methyltransferase domain-containing protein [Jatrophihabitantaceae bacterium]